MVKKKKDKPPLDCLVSVFELLNDRRYFAPIININYQEKNGERLWQIQLGGHRIYVLEFGHFKEISDDITEEQAVNAHLFVQTICACLVVTGCGLFRFRAVGRILLKSRGIEEWGADLRPNDPNANIKSDEAIQETFEDWYGACTQNLMIRRSLEDLYNSLIYPKEAPIFVYRALEWIKEGMNLQWEDLPRYLNLPKKEIREFKKLLHHPEISVRHGRKSGKKLRADASLFGAWSANVLEILNAIRAETEPNYVPMTPTQMAEVISRCAPLTIYE